MDLVPFNPAERIEITQGTLPHWQQARRTYFVTWRTADSIPLQLLNAWKMEREAWLVEHCIGPDEVDSLPDDQRREYHQRFAQHWHDALDKGHGECLLRQDRIRSVVENTLRHFDGSRYSLGDFVLMPNHVHLLVTPFDGHDIRKLCFSWKRFSSGQVNRLLGRKGDLWQTESFDHLIRHVASLRKLQCYIEDNPAKARLFADEYTLYQPPDWRR